MDNEKIIAFYVRRVKNGSTTIEAVPVAIREAVELEINNNVKGEE